jgi:F420 biosynthesis protein FbiB-like protein
LEKEKARVNTLDTIAARRSIRRFKDTPLPDGALQAILTAATQAPSAKNRQPWRFVVIQGDQRAEMVRIMRQGIEAMVAQGQDTGSALGSARIMEQAPVTIFVLNPEGLHPWLTRSVEQMFTDVMNIQSIGAAIQNMLLASLDLGLGSLWIGDIYYAYEALRDWLGTESELIAAVAFGYADESPPARPRRSADQVTRWM